MQAEGSASQCGILSKCSLRPPPPTTVRVGTRQLASRMRDEFASCLAATDCDYSR